MADQTLTTLDHVIEHLRSSPQPVFYLSRTATNLVGVDRWVGGFHFITLTDSWNGAHPRSFSPSNVPSIEPRGNVNIANWLLANAQVQAYIAKHTPAGYTPQIVLAMFDEQSERLCRELGYELIMPSVALRNRLDSKISTTEIGNAAGVPSVPNLLTTVSGWDDLRAQADAAGLGPDLVIQLPYGDSGRTTYFVSSREDYERIAKEITGSQIKAMRRINHVPLATEAVITRAGIIVGPVLREITGHPELTRFRGGWSGSETYPSLVDHDTRHRIGDLVERFSARLAEEGYRGILEVSVLLDTDTGDAYLGELNPRISGSSPHSNLTPGDTTLPLFAYHVLEYAGVEFDLDVDAIRTERERALDGQTWTTLIIQHPGPGVAEVKSAPETGRYRIAPDGRGLEFIAPDTDWQGLDDENEAFWFMAVGKGEVASVGVDLGMLMTRRRAQEDGYALLNETKHLITSLQRLYVVQRISAVRRFWRAGVRRLLRR